MLDRPTSDSHPNEHRSVSQINAETHELVWATAKILRQPCPDTFLGRRQECPSSDWEREAPHINEWINSPGLRPPSK
jgi:hypothetical protein